MTDDSPKQPTPPPPLGIHNLPFEILVDIFALVDVVDPWGSLGAAYGRGIAKLMLVCRNWWDMARRTPEFWRRINTAEPLDRVSLLLERSKGCTIDVRITYPWIRKYPPPWRDAVALIFPHAHRIRSLYANLHMDHYASIYQFLHGDMPALEHLYFVPMRDFRRKDRGNPAPHTDHDIAACESLSRRKYPRLRSMIAQRLYMPAPVDFWRTLRTLKMYDFPRTVSNEYLMRDVIAVLKANCGSRRVSSLVV
ncbi:hypothetical protein C8T65DRAFT_75183 [Cerioporus squamosus]|nr:hypothetical protein C8T65DRAFT_75183 [Cerioporus squamosus]